MIETQETEVLIIGAGPVGLALAIELGTRGLRCMVIEQNDRVGKNPRAKTTNVRTREHLRRWGIAENLRRASRLPPDYPSDIIFAMRLNGPQLTKIENASNCNPDRNDLYSAAHALSLPLKLIAPQDARLNRRYMAQMAIIRPDQHVAWRGNQLPEDVTGLLRQITGNLAA